MLFGKSSRIQYARFDLLNEGIVRDVYSIESDEGWRTQFHWYVVVADGEEQLMRERMAALSADLLNTLTAFGSELQRESVDVSGVYEFDEVFGAKRKPANLRSRLITATNSTFYRGVATRDRIVVIGATTYLMAANFQGTVALFRPEKSGTLTTLCQHDAIPSRAEAKIETVTSTFPCPTDADEQLLPWEGNQWEMHAAVDLKEWGGRRFVARLLVAGARFANSRIYIGALNDSSPPIENSWPPLNAVAENHDSAELILAAAGPYILINDWIPIRPDYMPLGQIYYRVVDNGLTEVCRVTSETIPPPGYAVKN